MNLPDVFYELLYKTLILWCLFLFFLYLRKSGEVLFNRRLLGGAMGKILVKTVDWLVIAFVWAVKRNLKAKFALEADCPEPSGSV